MDLTAPNRAHQPLPADTDRPPGELVERVDLRVRVAVGGRVRHLDPTAVVRPDRGLEQDRPDAADPQDGAGEDPGVTVVQPEPARVGMDVAERISQQEPVVGAKIRELVSRYCLYFERAIRSASDAGTIRVADPKAKPKELFAFLEGTLTQARIHDDASLLDGIADKAVRIVMMHGRTTA